MTRGRQAGAKPRAVAVSAVFWPAPAPVERPLFTIHTTANMLALGPSFFRGHRALLAAEQDPKILSRSAFVLGLDRIWDLTWHPP